MPGPVERLRDGLEGRNHRQVTARHFERDQAERHHHEKDRAPAEVLDQHAADHRPDRGREHDAETEDADGASLLGARELAHDHHVRDRREDAGGHAFENAHGDHHRIVSRQAAHDAAGHEQQVRADVGLAQAEALQEPRREQQRQRGRGHERGGDPLRAVLADVEIAAHVRHGDVDDRRGHDRGHHADHHREQDQPAEAGPVAHPQVLDGRGGRGSHGLVIR